MVSRRLFTTIKYKRCFGVWLCLEPLLCSSVSEVAPHLEYQRFRRTTLSVTGWGSSIWCFSSRNGELDLSHHLWDQSQLKNKHNNKKRKRLSDTHAAWSLGSPAPPVCVAAGASTAALHNSREREEKETHQCEKHQRIHFQTHLVLSFGCQGSSEQQDEKTSLPPNSPAARNCRSSRKQRGFRILLRATRRGSCKGSWQGDKNPQSQACFSILSTAPSSFKPLTLKNKQRRTLSDSPPVKAETPHLLMTPQNSNYRLNWYDKIVGH